MTQTKQHQKKQTVVSVVSQMASLICTSGESSGKEEPSPSVSSESSVPCSVSLLSPSSSSQSVKYGNVVYVVLLLLFFYTFITFQFILQPVCAIPIGGMTGHSLVFMLLSPLRPEINTSRLLQKIFRKKNTLMRQKFKKYKCMILPVFPLHLSELMGREARYVFGFWSGGLDTIRCTRPLVLRMVVTALVWDTPVISSSFTYKTESQSVRAVYSLRKSTENTFFTLQPIIYKIFTKRKCFFKLF